MLAPFTAGWQSTDLHPLVIERSEVEHLIFFFLIFYVNLFGSSLILGKAHFFQFYNNVQIHSSTLFFLTKRKSHLRIAQ